MEHRERDILLVASTGGHLEELAILASRLPAGRRRWMTFDTPQARDLLAGEEVVFVPFATTRDYSGTARILAFVTGWLPRSGATTIVSTGASIAAAVFPVARALGMDCHYVESATRTAGPSATGRLVAMVPGTNLYTQHRSWVGARWSYSGSVFDAFEAHELDAAETPERVVVSLGTHPRYGFRRLVERLTKILPKDADVLWQVGATDVRGLGIDSHRAVPRTELERRIRDANVVVMHAGVGSALSAFSAGKCPVYIPRRQAHGEHVDDHQRALASALGARSLVVTAEADDVTLVDLVRAARRVVVPADAVRPFVLSDRRR